MSASKVAVVSGGSSGIGRAIVERLLADGWVVHTCGRDREKLERLERELPGVKTAVCDVTDRLAVRAFAGRVLGAANAIDLLVSNAGGLHEIDFTRPDLAGVDLTADLRGNVEGAVNFVAEFLPGLFAAGKGAILVVSSGYALAPATRAPLYSAAKAALHSFAKALRRQLEPKRITVTELLPPVVDTPATAHRSVAKLTAGSVADHAVGAVLAGHEECRPGQVKFLPLLPRIAPSLAERIVAGT